MTTTTTDFRTLTGSYTIDPPHSRFGFLARHTIGPKVRGAFSEAEGAAIIDGEDPAMSSVSVVLQSASIDTRNKHRDRYLRTKFLDVETYPTISFTSTSISHEVGDAFVVTGDLTIKDVIKSIDMPLEVQGAAKDPLGSDRIVFEGGAVINRKDWGVIWNAALGVVSKKVRVELKISVIRNV